MACVTHEFFNVVRRFSLLCFHCLVSFFKKVIKSLKSYALNNKNSESQCVTKVRSTEQHWLRYTQTSLCYIIIFLFLDIKRRKLWLICLTIPPSAIIRVQNKHQIHVLSKNILSSKHQRLKSIGLSIVLDFFPCWFRADFCTFSDA